MAVPTLITDLSTTAASNAPSGSDSPATLDDIQRAHAAFIAQLYDEKVTLTGDESIAGAKTFASAPVVPGLNGGQLAGLRNKIINGGFAINQRAYVSGAAVGAGLYGHDRWKMAASADTYTYATTANKTTVTIPAGKVLQQVIEGLNLHTGTYCLSWEGTAQGKIGAGALAASGVTGSITGGTDTTIEFGPGTVANIQLELGTTATAFEQRTYGIELMLCQRYLPVVDVGCLTGLAYSATTGIASCQFPVPARAGSSGMYSVGTFETQYAGGAIASATVAFSESAINSCAVAVTSSGMSVGMPFRLFNGTAGAAKLVFTGCEL